MSKSQADVFQQQPDVPSFVILPRRGVYGIRKRQILRTKTRWLTSEALANIAGTSFGDGAQSRDRASAYRLDSLGRWPTANFQPYFALRQLNSLAITFMLPVAFASSALCSPP